MGLDPKGKKRPCRGREWQDQRSQSVQGGFWQGKENGIRGSLDRETQTRATLLRAPSDKVTRLS